MIEYSIDKTDENEVEINVTIDLLKRLQNRFTDYVRVVGDTVVHWTFGRPATPFGPIRISIPALSLGKLEFNYAVSVIRPLLAEAGAHSISLTPEYIESIQKERVAECTFVFRGVCYTLSFPEAEYNGVFFLDQSCNLDWVKGLTPSMSFFVRNMLKDKHLSVRDDAPKEELLKLAEFYPDWSVEVTPRM